MYLLLLAFGAVLTVAGVVLAASGVSYYERAFDASIVTPGIVAAVGGLLLIGLGLALRVLGRIEQALAERPATRAARPGETAEPVAATERTSEPSRIAFPSRVALRSQTVSAALASAPAAAPVSAGGGRREADVAEKIPAVARLETTQLVEDAEVSLSPTPSTPTNIDAAVAELDKGQGRLARRKNGPAAPRMTPRLDLGARPAASERPAGPAFDSLWPKAPRPLRAAPAPAAPAAEPEQASEPAADTAQTSVPDEVSAEVSVLKSGVVDGMAYTLYSDGSIEAQLPQGTLRFGSITELRNHIEQSA